MAAKEKARQGGPGNIYRKALLQLLLQQLVQQWPGWPCPFEAFITWPTKNPIIVVLPARYCSTCLGLAAITSSIIFSMRAGVADLLRLFLLVDDGEVHASARRRGRRALSAFLLLMAPLSSRSAERRAPAMVTGDCSIRGRGPSGGPCNSLSTMLASALGTLRLLGLALKLIGAACVAVSVAASPARQSVLGDQALALGLRQLGQLGCGSASARPPPPPAAAGRAPGNSGSRGPFPCERMELVLPSPGVAQARLLHERRRRIRAPRSGARSRTPGPLRTKRKRVHVFHLGLGAQLRLAARAHADVGVAAQRALLHVAVADAGVEDDLLQARQVVGGLLGGAHVRLADDLDQRRAGAVEVHLGLGVASRQSPRACSCRRPLPYAGG